MTSSANNLTPATDDGGKKNDDAVETHHSPQRVSHHKTYTLLIYHS